MKKNIFQNKKLLIIIPVLLLIVAVVGVTYAFFNYTRTGASNTASVGRIYFNTDQANDTLTLTNVFPSTGVPAGADSVSVHIVGDTAYFDGEEYRITLVNVVNTINEGTANEKTVPINYEATYQATTNKVVGSQAVSDYYSERTANVYDLTATGVVEEGVEVLKGYIAPNATGIDGTLTIKAYLDASKVVISDTLTGGAVNVQGYTNGTPTSEGVTVLTTSEWNALQGNSTLSFKIKAEANEGKWLNASSAVPTVLGCDGCKFMYTTNEYVFGGPNNEFNISNNKTVTLVSDIEQAETVTTDYRTLSSNIFLGFTEVDDGYGNMVVDKAYACGIKQGEPNGETPFCLEGFTYETEDASTIYAGNVSRITGSALWDDSSLSDECSELDGGVSCNGTVSTEFYDGGWSTVKLQNNSCYIDGNWGTFSCTEE